MYLYHIAYKKSVSKIGLPYQKSVLKIGLPYQNRGSCIVFPVTSIALSLVILGNKMLGRSAQSLTLCQRGIGTGMSKAPVLVPIFPYAAEGGARPSSYFQQGN